MLTESRSKELFTPLPTLWLQPVVNKEPVGNNVYECPIYKVGGGGWPREVLTDLLCDFPRKRGQDLSRLLYVNKNVLYGVMKMKGRRKTISKG